MLKHAYALGAAQAVKEAYALSGAALGAGVGGLTGYVAPEWFGEDLSRGGGALRGAVGGGVLGGLAGGIAGLRSRVGKVEKEILGGAVGEPKAPPYRGILRERPPGSDPSVVEALADIQRRTKLSPEDAARVAEHNAWEALPLEEKLRRREAEIMDGLRKDRGNRSRVDPPDSLFGGFTPEEAADPDVPGSAAWALRELSR